MTGPIFLYDAIRLTDHARQLLCMQFAPSRADEKLEFASVTGGQKELMEVCKKYMPIAIVFMGAGLCLNPDFLKQLTNINFVSIVHDASTELRQIDNTRLWILRMASGIVVGPKSP